MGLCRLIIALSNVEQYVAAHTGGEGFDVVYDTVGGATLDDSFVAAKVYTGHVLSSLGWGTHKLAPLSFRGATYSGVFTLLPMLTGRGRAHHGEIMREATRLVEAGLLTPLVDERRFTLDTALAAHALGGEREGLGKVVVDIVGVETGNSKTEADPSLRCGMTTKRTGNSSNAGTQCNSRSPSGMTTRKAKQQRFSVETY